MQRGIVVDKKLSSLAKKSGGLCPLSQKVGEQPPPLPPLFLYTPLLQVWSGPLSGAPVLLVYMVQPKICDHYSGLLFSWLHNYTALHSSYHIGEASLIPKLLLPCV